MGSHKLEAVWRNWEAPLISRGILDGDLGDSPLEGEIDHINESQNRLVFKEFQSLASGDQ